MTSPKATNHRALAASVPDSTHPVPPESGVMATTPPAVGAPMLKRIWPEMAWPSKLTSPCQTTAWVPGAKPSGSASSKRALVVSVLVRVTPGMATPAGSKSWNSADADDAGSLNSSTTVAGALSSVAPSAGVLATNSAWAAAGAAVATTAPALVATSIATIMRRRITLCTVALSAPERTACSVFSAALAGTHRGHPLATDLGGTRSRVG